MPCGIERTLFVNLDLLRLVIGLGDGIGHRRRDAATTARATSRSSRGRLCRNLGLAALAASAVTLRDALIRRLDGDLLSLESLDRLLHHPGIRRRKLLAKLGGLHSLHLSSIVCNLQRSGESRDVGDLRGLGLNVRPQMRLQAVVRAEARCWPMWKHWPDRGGVYRGGPGGSPASCLRC